MKSIQQAIDCYDEGITPANIYKINQLQAMRLVELAWQDVDTTTAGVKQGFYQKWTLLQLVQTSS